MALAKTEGTALVAARLPHDQDQVMWLAQPLYCLLPVQRVEGVAERLNSS
jgi:hypothetical protein